MIIFRVGAEDAKHLVQEVHPVFNEEDLINLPKYSMYLKLMIDGATSKPFSANTIALTFKPCLHKQEIIKHSREQYGRLKEEVEYEISSRHKEMKQLLSAEQNSLFNHF